MNIHGDVRYTFIDEWCGENSLNDNVQLGDLLHCYDGHMLSGIWISLHRDFSDDKFDELPKFQERFYFPNLMFNFRNSKEIAEESRRRLPNTKHANEPILGSTMVDGIRPKIYKISEDDFENDLTRKLHDSLVHCCESRSEKRVMVVLPWGTQPHSTRDMTNIKYITVVEVLKYCKNSAQKCYIYFNEKDSSDFINKMKLKLKSSDDIKSSDILTYLSMDPMKFIVNDNQDGIFITDADNIEGFECRTIISLFARKVYSDYSLRDCKLTLKGGKSIERFDKTQVNIFTRAIANLVVLEKEGEETHAESGMLANND